MNNKYKLSILIPSRCEMFLAKTVEDLLSNIEGDTEIIIGLDGQWSNPPVVDDNRVSIVFYPESIGQRGMTNQLCRLSNAKYIMKVDAHCAFDKGFDVKMIEAFEKAGDNNVIIPIMRNLHVFNFKCSDGHTRYQGNDGPCTECGKETFKDIVWIPKISPQSKSYCFDSEPHFQYFGEYCKTSEFKKDLAETGLTESMSIQGSCFMLTREKYWELNIGDENFGSWGSQGIQIALSFWLSGGKVLVNHKTWYAHCFRTQGGTFGFPYSISGRQVSRAKKLAGDKLYENNWPNQIYPSSWLLDKFWPVKGWSDVDRAKLTEAGTIFTNFRNEKLGILGVVPLVPDPMTDHTSSVSPNSVGKEMSVPTMSLSSLSSSSTISSKDIGSIGDKSKVEGITTPPIITDMIKDGNIFPLSTGDRSNQPGIYESMDSIESFIDSDLSIPHTNNSSPIPATIDIINFNLSKNSINSLGGDTVYDKHIIDVHNTSISEINNKSKGIIFYTDNQLELKIAHKVQRQLRSIGLPIVSVSLKPMTNMGKNIYLPLERGKITMFKQQLAALEASDAEIIFFCEHDVIYHPSHFEFTPEKRDVFYYNVNVYKIRSEDGFALWVNNCIQVSGMCGYRDELIKHYKERIALAESSPIWNGNWGYEPGTPGKTVFKTQFNQETWMSPFPNLDIRHNHNLTKNRWSPDLFRDKKNCEGWTETTVDKLEGWEGFSL